MVRVRAEEALTVREVYHSVAVSAVQDRAEEALTAREVYHSMAVSTVLEVLAVSATSPAVSLVQDQARVRAQAEGTATLKEVCQ